MDSMTYGIVQGLRIVPCAQCACVYGVPEALLLAAIKDQRPLHCPRGHAWTPAESEPGSSPSQMIFKLQAALVDSRARLTAAEARIEALTPLASPSLSELRRRSNMLAERAENASQGRALCPHCGKQKYRSRLAEHIRRRHRQLLIEGDDGVKTGEA